MANHVHLLVVVDSPELLPNFMERFKTESALAINKLMGTDKRNLWCDGYDSPSLLTVDDVIEKVVYIYTNPSRDNLVDSITDFPGLNTWQEFLAGGGARLCPRISRKNLPILSRSKLSMKQQDSLAAALKATSTESHSLRIEPNAWMLFFGIVSDEDRAEVNQTIERKVLGLEAEYSALRREHGFSTIGSLRLKNQPIDQPYIPQRTGKRTYCICSNIPFRIAFLNFVRELVKLAQDWYQRALNFDYSLQFPLGLFPPNLPRRGDFLSKALLSAW